MDIYHKINDDIIFLFKHFLNQFMYFDKIVYIFIKIAVWNPEFWSVIDKNWMKQNQLNFTMRKTQNDL